MRLVVFFPIEPMEGETGHREGGDNGQGIEYLNPGGVVPPGAGKETLDKRGHESDYPHPSSITRFRIGETAYGAVLSAAIS